jgi:copper(I)-binding protein
MHQVDSINVPAKGEAILKPMGYHIMLIDLQKPIKEGEKINLELKFSDGESVQVVAPVKKFTVNK